MQERDNKQLGMSRVVADLLLGTMLPRARALGWMVREGAGLGAQTDLRACWAHPMPNSISCSLFEAIRLFRSISYSDAMFVSLGVDGRRNMAPKVLDTTFLKSSQAFVFTSLVDEPQDIAESERF